MTYFKSFPQLFAFFSQNYTIFRTLIITKKRVFCKHQISLCGDIFLAYISYCYSNIYNKLSQNKHDLINFIFDLLS